MKKFSLLFALALLSTGLFAEVEEKPELSFFGARLSGNKEGSIPPWRGGIITPPANYKPGDWHPDPFADDVPLLTIDQSNVAQYRHKLSAGHQAMLARYPDSYYLKVYPSRRSVSYPPAIAEQTLKYQGKARVVDDGAGIAGIVQGIPFPSRRMASRRSGICASVTKAAATGAISPRR